MKGTHKHMEAYLIYFDDHRCVSQSEESKCMWTHGKGDIMPSVSCVHTYLLSSDWERHLW